jgi:hypothetical protein
MPAAEELLSGPRGRALCGSVALGRTGGLFQLHLLADSGDAGAARAWLLERVATTDLAALAALAAASGELAFFGDLADVVTRAVYWQQPFDAAADRVLAEHGVLDAMLPVAAAITAAPGTRWWASPAALDSQAYAQFLGDHALPGPRLSGAAGLLGTWRADTVADERSAHDRPDDPSAPWSGHWWSSPALSGLPVTTRALPGLGAARLVLVEDSLGWRSARCWPLAPRAGVRVYEVGGPDAWAELAGRYPLDVSRSRRHDWWRVTGWAGRWVMPDYAAVAADYDAVHVSAAGYLAAAGRALPVGDARTMLAGWEPDATWWLTDVLSPAGPPDGWTESGDGDAGVCAGAGARAGWRPATDSR